jgi:hypothetical protein
LLEIADDLLTRGGQKTIRVVRLGQIGFDVKGGLFGLIKRRAELEGVDVFSEAEAGGDVGKGGVDCSYVGC